MTRTLLSRRLGYSILCFAGMAFAAGCSDDPTEPGDGSFTIGLNPATITVAQGGNATSTVTLTPTDFSGAIALTLEGAPTGLTASFDPTPATTTSVLTVTTVAALAPGSYTLTVRGTAAGVADRTATLTVEVVAAGTGTITVNFNDCSPSERPVWLAFQDGTGPWTRINGNNNLYEFTMASTKGGMAFATVNDSSIVTVEYFSEADLHQGSLDYVVRLDRCPILGGESLSGSVTGLDAGDVATVSIGSRHATVTGNSAFQVSNAFDGTMDLVGYASAAAGPAAGDRIVLRRAFNPSGTIAAVDFQGSESVAAASALMTLNGLAGGELIEHGMYYYTANAGGACQIGRLYDRAPATGSTFTAFGVPAVNQNATDWHAVAVATSLNNNSFRTLHEYFVALAPRTLTLGSELPAPAVTTLAGPYKRLQGIVTLPAEYQSRVVFRYQDQAGSRPSVLISATMGWLGGTNANVSLPDFSAIPGWDNGWAPASSATVKWFYFANTATDPPHCAPGAKYISAGRTGTS